MQRLRHEVMLLHSKVCTWSHSQTPIPATRASYTPGCVLWVWSSVLLQCSPRLMCGSFLCQLESREALITSLTQQLQQCEREKASLEVEFASYRKHSQVRWSG